MILRHRLPSPSSSHTIKFQTPRQLVERATAHASNLGFASLIVYLQAHIRSMADHVPAIDLPKRKRQEHWQFMDPADVRVQEDVKYAAIDLLKEYPSGFTMRDMKNIMEADFHGAEIPRALETLYGRCLKNLGYAKVHTRVNKPGDRIKWGYIYRPRENNSGPPSV